MKQAVEFAKEILRKQAAVKTSKSQKLKNDYSRSIKQDIRDLKYYCYRKNLNYNEVMNQARRD